MLLHPHRTHALHSQQHNVSAGVKGVTCHIQDTNTQLGTANKAEREASRHKPKSGIWPVDNFCLYHGGKGPLSMVSVPCVCLTPQILGSKFTPDISQYLSEGVMTTATCLSPTNFFFRNFSTFSLPDKVG